MLRAFVAVAVSVFCGVAHAAPEALPRAPNKDRTLVELGAVSPRLAATLNMLMWHQLDDVTSDANADTGHCEVGMATTAFVSWWCGASGMSDSGPRSILRSSSYYVTGDTVRAMTLDDLFVPGAVPDKLSGLLGCDPKECDLSCELLIEDTGIACRASDEKVVWRLLAEKASPILAAGNPFSFGAAVPGADPYKGKSAGALHAWLAKRRVALPAIDQRFVAEDGAVLDRVTGLAWTARDNGEDIDFADAQRYPATLGAGWRVPVWYELALLSDAVDAHTNPNDCNRGKKPLLLTPLIQLSCDTVWSNINAFDMTRGAFDRQKHASGRRALAVRDHRLTLADGERTNGVLADRVTGLTWTEHWTVRAAAEVKGRLAAGERLPTRAEVRALRLLIDLRGTPVELLRFAAESVWVDEGKGPELAEVGPRIALGRHDLSPLGAVFGVKKSK